MKLSNFEYLLPQELIAQYPLEKRDSARLLVLERKTGRLRHCIFSDITDYLAKDDLLVLNDTKVLAARLFGRRPSGGKVELLLLKQKNGLSFDCLIKPGRVKLGEKIIFNGEKISAIISGKNEVTFSQDAQNIYDLGVMPLPPYIKREAEPLDSEYYQTVYAREEGAIASPTAGLHFTKELMEKITSGGVNLAYLTLHVGHATFKPVKTEDIREHKMDTETFRIPEQAIKLIEKSKKAKGRVIAVGTTSCRALESFAAGKNEGETDLFIYPGYKFKLVDCLLTNFHLPRTTLFMLVCAFCAAGASASGGAGLELAKRAYQEAVSQKYRFYSYGDCMLII